MHEGVPYASAVESLPGFSCSETLKQLVRVMVTTMAALRTNKICLLTIFCLFFGAFDGTAACSPSFFTREHRSPPEALASQALVIKSGIDTNSIEDPVAGMVEISNTTPPPVSTSSIYINPKFKLIGYGPKKEKKNTKRKCRKQEFVECFNGGSCYSEFANGKRRSICHCSPLFHGDRCDIPMDRNVMASAINGSDIPTSAAYSALSFFIIMAIVTVAVAVYGYRRMAQQHCEDSMDEDVTWSTSRRVSLADVARNKRSSNATCTTSPNAIVETLPDSYYRKHSMITPPGNLIRLPTPHANHELRSTPKHVRKISLAAPHFIRREDVVD